MVMQEGALLVIILGIDPGLANTGWGVVETRGSVCRARAYGCVSTSSSESIDRRLGKIHEGISKAIETYAPSQLAIEKIFFGENSRSALATAHARGAALVAAAEAGLELGEYTPMQIKQAVVGTGSADKLQVIFMVRSILALDHDPRPDHCADALAAAICHANLSRTQRLTREGAAVQVFEQQRAQERLDAATARGVTAAATAARLAAARGKGSPLGHARQSRRNTQ
ncbi:crossover junction endodeoxyribonuclease RuvC [Tractidigestivibacter sp.]|uniref:crossover junction endodeoxyribonuclease RuvC n=1 Tax=Tractidigestivibacter sp. TaxID=2847320 RepID=UPI002A82B848|nr:crossover junction endodeoxyribonuclease RuvC [Tractidigestivibacter sp.]MDY4533842.1 crossover junction endodeoxyribonuclease RuvC [Tractidigestivibacter sp.]MDY5272068.1 crossover junction endodeoxyribonuclease RuvC [Tractidigestivibacter sp.]